MTEDRSVLSRVAEPPDDTWRYGPLDDHVADIYLPADSPAAMPVVLVHGGFWRPEYDRAHLRVLASALAEAGHLVVSLEYRRIPGDPDATVADLELALERLPHLLATHGHDRYLLAGHSAGGHLALLLAHRSASLGLAGCVALAPVADLQLAADLALDGDAVLAFLGCAARDRADLDPARLPAPELAVVLLHGERDTLVPLAVARSYAESTGIPLETCPECAHFEWIDPASKAWPHLLAALSRDETAR